MWTGTAAEGVGFHGDDRDLFPSRWHDQPHLSTRQYARIVTSQTLWGEIPNYFPQ